MASISQKRLIKQIKCTPAQLGEIIKSLIYLDMKTISITKQDDVYKIVAGGK